MNTFGKNIKLSIFGESHGKAIGCTLDGIPAGIKLNMELIHKFMARRMSDGKLGTPRIEKDIPIIMSGIKDSKTNGFPISIIIENNNTRSKDYTNDILPRPSHADYVAHIKHNGKADMNGGGHFSGRLTAPLVFAGALIMQILNAQGIYIGSHINKLKDVCDDTFDYSEIDYKELIKLTDKKIPLLNEEKEIQVIKTIENARDNGDSVGGIIEFAICGLKAGYGSPFFDSIESTIAKMIFSVPAVKGIEFGEGFNFCDMFGSEANDCFALCDNKIKTETNNNGGINGGISNGMPIVFKTVIKPTPSISKELKTVNLKTMQEQILSTRGRHDPCIVLRAIPVIEAVTAIALYDIILDL